MVSLVKGQKISLAKEAPTSKRFCVGLGWDVNKGLFGGGHGYDLDASAFVLRNGRLSGKNDVIYYGNKGNSKSAVYHHGDNLTGAGDGDDEQITVALDKLDSDVDKVVFVVNIYQAKARKQSFGKVKNAFIRLVDEDTNTEVLRYDLSKGGVGDVSALIFAELYKKDGEWKFNAIGEGSKANSIDELASNYR